MLYIGFPIPHPFYFPGVWGKWGIRFIVPRGSSGFWGNNIFMILCMYTKGKKVAKFKVRVKLILLLEDPGERLMRMDNFGETIFWSSGFEELKFVRILGNEVFEDLIGKPTRCLGWIFKAKRCLIFNYSEPEITWTWLLKTFSSAFSVVSNTI